MSVARNFGLAALALGAAAPFAGGPYAAARVQIDIGELAGIVARQEDHVDALELAAWIRQRTPGLRVIDVRSEAEFRDDAIPGAENLPIERIGSAAFSERDVIVLYSEGGAHAAQAWVFLRAMGLRQVYFLRGGMQDWLDEVIHPVLPEDATLATQKSFEATAELSRYFGGVPRIGTDAEATSSNGPLPPKKPRRRGC